MGRLVWLLVPGTFSVPAHGNAGSRYGLAFPGFPERHHASSNPPCQAELIEHRPHSKEEPEQPAAGKTMGSRSTVPQRGSGSQGGPSHAKRTVGGGAGESYLCNCCCLPWDLFLARLRARCVGRGSRGYMRAVEGDLLPPNLRPLGVQRDDARQANRDPGPELLSHCAVGPAAFCCRDIERSVVAPGRIDDGRFGGFCLPFSSGFRAVLESGTCLRV